MPLAPTLASHRSNEEETQGLTPPTHVPSQNTRRGGRAETGRCKSGGRLFNLCGGRMRASSCAAGVHSRGALPRVCTR